MTRRNQKRNELVHKISQWLVVNEIAELRCGRVSHDGNNIYRADNWDYVDCGMCRYLGRKELNNYGKEQNPKATPVAESV